MSSLPEVSEPDLFEPSLYVNRELSWLSFNERVLDQARDARWPLLERLKFLAIHAANLDEFYMIRVSGLHEQLDAAVSTKQADGIEVRDLLAQIRKVAQRQLNEASLLYREGLISALAEKGIRVRSVGDLSEDELAWAKSYFRASVFPVLTPLGVDPVHPFPFLSNLSLSLAVELNDPSSSEHRFARVKVPEILPRFVAIGGKHDEVTDLLLMEELIAENLQELFPGLEIRGCHPFRVTRDMDIDVLEDAAGDLLAAVDREVRRRRFGAAACRRTFASCCSTSWKSRTLTFTSPRRRWASRACFNWRASIAVSCAIRPWCSACPPFGRKSRIRSA
jgi:polyphosphate kinase